MLLVSCSAKFAPTIADGRRMGWKFIHGLLFLLPTSVMAQARTANGMEGSCSDPRTNGKLLQRVWQCRYRGLKVAHLQPCPAHPRAHRQAEDPLCFTVCDTRGSKHMSGRRALPFISNAGRAPLTALQWMFYCACAVFASVFLHLQVLVRIHVRARNVPVAVTRLVLQALSDQDVTTPALSNSDHMFHARHCNAGTSELMFLRPRRAEPEAPSCRTMAQ